AAGRPIVEGEAVADAVDVAETPLVVFARLSGVREVENEAATATGRRDRRMQGIWGCVGVARTTLQRVVAAAAARGAAGGTAAAIGAWIRGSRGWHGSLTGRATARRPAAARARDSVRFVRRSVRPLRQTRTSWSSARRSRRTAR